MHKKIYAITALFAAIALFFSGCDTALTFNAAENLIRPPRLSGEEGALQRAFENVMTESGEYILKYPSVGSYKSPFVRLDCDGDGSEEAFVFYSLKTQEMSVNFYMFDFVDGQWLPVSTMPGEGNDVYSVDFCDLNNDGIMEMLIGWSSLEAKINKKLSVYCAETYSSGISYRVLAIESYTSMYTLDIDNDSQIEILLALINSTSDTYTTDARLLKLTNENDTIGQQITSVGQCNLFSEITAITSITANVVDGKNYVYIDETAGDSYLTEILYWDEDGMGLTPLLEIDKMNISSCPTSRSLPLTCADIDSDGEIEIPATRLITGSSVVKKTVEDAPATPAESIYVVNWISYNGTDFDIEDSYIGNDYDGFRFSYEEDLMADWVVIYYPDDGISQFFSTEPKENEDEQSVRTLLFTISALPVNSVVDSKEYLAETDEFKYSCKITTDGEDAGLSLDDISLYFYLTA